MKNYLLNKYSVIPLVIIALIIIGLIEPNRRTRITQICCRRILLKYGDALVQYGLDHEHFPKKDNLEGIQTLLNEEYIEAIRNCPDSKTEDFAYIYRGGYKYNGNHETPIMWDKYPHPNGDIFVIFGAGNIERYNKVEFEALMKKHQQNEKGKAF